MREADRRHVEELLQKAGNGILSRSDAVALLIMVRGDAPKGSLLRDLGDGIAHDERDRGSAFNELRNFARQFTRAASVGGVIPRLELYPIDSVILELEAVAKKLHLHFDPDAAMPYRVPLAFAFAEAVDGTQFVVNKMVTVELAARPWPMWNIMMLVEIRGVLTVRSGIVLAGSLLLGSAEEELAALGHPLDSTGPASGPPSTSAFFRGAPT